MMDSIARLCVQVEEAYARALGFFLAQTGNGAEGWGPEPGDKACPWTTSEVLFTLGPQDGVPDEVLSRGLNWLEKVQNPDGSWWSHAYGPNGDTPATAWATTVLLQQYGPHSAAAQRGVLWLCQNFRGGLTTFPTAADAGYLQCHFYSTAFALRALARAQRSNFTSLVIQEGITLLRRARIPGQGWGYQADSLSDPTFTAYVLHGLLDVRRIRRVAIPPEDVREAVAWLLDIRTDTGWWDWQGVQSSTEATGYALYVILSSGCEVPVETLVKPLSWLLEVQRPDDGWALDPASGGGSNNWVTHSVLLGLKAFWLTHSPRAGQSVPTEARAALAGEPRDLDLGTLPVPSSVRWARHYTNGRSFGWPGTTEEVGLPASLYVRQIPDSLSVPYSRPYDHTMFRALDAYVEQRLPGAAVEEIVSEGGTVEVHGVYPTHLAAVAEDLGFREWAPIEFRPKRVLKRFNCVRPSFSWARRDEGSLILVVTVVPGRDYCNHYATLIRHHMHRLTTRADNLIRLFRYPDAEKDLVQWTGLTSPLVERGDRVLIGYVEEVRTAIESHGGAECLGCHDNDFYGACRYRLPDNTVLNLLGVKFCFWGSISEALASGLCANGCTEILYVGKLGALTKPEDVYSRIFCPSSYVLLDYAKILSGTAAPENAVLEMYPQLDSGCHVSVPTVLEEDYVQREVAAGLKAQSIDNEISQIARAVARHNTLHGRSTTFSALHIATDYVRRPRERALEVPFDLSKDRMEAVKRAKQRTIDELVTSYLLPYLRIAA